MTLASGMKEGTFDDGGGTAAADDSSDALLGSTTTADVGGTDKELEPSGVSELLVVVDVVE